MTHEYRSCTRKIRYKTEPVCSVNLEAYECLYCGGWHKATRLGVRRGPKCELSARPSGKICGSQIGVQALEFDQLGVPTTKYACASCRSKMLTGSPEAWAW